MRWRFWQHAAACGWRVVMGGPEPANYRGAVSGRGRARHRVAAKASSRWKRILRGDAASAQIPGLIFRGRGRRGRYRRRAHCSPISMRSRGPTASASISTQYLRAWREHHGAGSVSVITARGCPYHCRWCSHSTFGKTHRRRGARAVVGRSGVDPRALPARQLWFADDVFTIHHGWLDEYAARDAAPRTARSLRVHHARRSPERRAWPRNLRNWAATACGSARKAARSACSMPWSAASPSRRCATRWRSCKATASAPACSSCGATRARSSRISRPPTST